jgi:hypothetical protein
MRQKSEAVNDQRDENPIAFIVVASSLKIIQKLERMA